MNLTLIESNELDKLKEFIQQVEIKLIHFEKKLVALKVSKNNKTKTPRFNRLTIEIYNGTEKTIEELLLTVYRTNSKIGADNFDVVPIKTYELLPKTKGRYKVFAFDPFNEKFDSIRIRISTKQDWEQRKKVNKWFSKSSHFSKRKDYSFKQLLLKIVKKL